MAVTIKDAYHESRVKDTITILRNIQKYTQEVSTACDLVSKNQTVKTKKFKA